MFFFKRSRKQSTYSKSTGRLDGNVFLWLAYSTYPSSSWSSWGKNKAVLSARLGYQPINIASTCSLQLDKVFQSYSGNSIKWTQRGTHSSSLHQVGVSLTSSIEWGELLPSLGVVAAPQLLWNLGYKLSVWSATKALLCDYFVINILSFLANISCVLGKGGVTHITSYWLSVHIPYQFVII